MNFRKSHGEFIRHWVDWNFKLGEPYFPVIKSNLQFANPHLTWRAKIRNCNFTGKKVLNGLLRCEAQKIVIRFSATLKQKVHFLGQWAHLTERRISLLKTLPFSSSPCQRVEKIKKWFQGHGHFSFLIAPKKYLLPCDLFKLKTSFMDFFHCPRLLSESCECQTYFNPRA